MTAGPEGSKFDHGGAVRAAIRNLGWLLASRGVLAVLSLLYLGLATRTLGLADFGRFALVTGAAQGLAVLVGFQTWQVVVRFGMDHRARGEDAALGRLYRACVLLDAASAALGLVLAAVILAVGREQLGISHALLRDTAILTAAQLLSIRSAAIGILRLSDRFGEAAVADSVTPVVRFVGAVVAATLLPTLQAFLWAWSAAEIATAASYWLILARSGDVGRMWSARLSGRLTAENRGIGRFMVNSNVVSSLGLAAKHIPLLLVGGFVGPAAAGAFRLALQIAQALAKLAQLIARAAFPEVVRTVRGATPAAVAGALGRMVLASSVGAAVILVLIALLGRALLVLVGGDASYAGAYDLLLWLAAAGSIDLAVVGLEPVLLAADRSGAAMLARGAGVAAQLALSLLLLPRVGAAGASVGVFGASLVTAIMLGALVRRYVRSREADG
ncbi:lipopolysaccharide biosynthesis protein [Sphingomonas sp. BK580]|uniref:lipopolysaccharide biosynthesis protein n=1 Tax=Sphingomonas sp. BK580 TaxID=2586972 RepID=UPI00161C6587|nr:lipopolysaccharide biosynthesis protein [Sphingomonas sp. BK580]MBB3693596.1 O-antigen/teichoic acid export membrane protein [Sphingomonas sp. BK580]